MTVDDIQSRPTDSGGRGAPLDFSELALDLHAEPDPERTLQRLAEHAVSAFGIDDAGILLGRPRARAEVSACTSDAVRRAHDRQLEIGEGPCFEAIEGDEATFLVPDTAADERWPRWCAEVAALGYRSTLSVQLATRERRYGSLNLYARAPEAFDDDDVAVAAIFGRHAAVALASSQDAEGLHRAMDARKLIGVAIGILMERYGLEVDPAFDVLRRYSQHHNVKLREVARRVVEGRGLPD